MSINLGQLLNRDNLNAAFMSKVDDNNILGSVTLTGASAKLGVGTATPSKTLHVIGDAIIAGTGSSISGASLANANLLIGSVANGIGIDTNEIYSAGSALYIGTIGAYSTFFRNGTTDIMTLSNNGNVSIGTTSITDTRLTIEGTHASNVRVMTFGAGTSRSLKLTKTDGISVDGSMYLQPNTADNIYLASGGGKVAIGTSSAPLQRLDVAGSIRLTGNIHSNASYIGFVSDGSSALPVKAGSLAITDNYSDTAPTNGLYVKGNVGIGVSNPSAKLEVHGGNIRIRDTIGSALSFDMVGYTSTHSLWLIANNATEPTNAYIVIGTKHDWDRQIGINYTPGTTGAGAGLLQIGQTQKNHANFTHGETALYTNGAERVRITKDGDLGVGVTSVTSGYKFEVNGSAKLGGALNLAGAISFDDASRYWLVTATNWGLYWDTSTNELQYHGAGTKRFSVDLDNGLTYIDGNLTFNGNTATSINPNRHTTANTAGTDLTLQAGGATSGATDKNGGNLYLASGISTGTGYSGIYFQTATAGSSATTDRTPTTKWVMHQSGVFEAQGAQTIRTSTGSLTLATVAGSGSINLSPVSGGAVNITTSGSGGNVVVTTGTGTSYMQIVNNSTLGGILVTSSNAIGDALSITDNGLTSGDCVELFSNSTAGTASDNTKMLNIVRSGANTNASHTAYGIYANITNTGTTSTNVAGYFNVTGATNNYAILVPNGNVGIGNSAPTEKIDVTGNIKASANITGSVLISTVSVGTAPLTVTSTTLVTNLNADYLEGQHGSYYLSRANHTGTQAASTITGLASVATTGTLDSLSNVTMTNKQINDSLKWNGTAWVNTPLTTNGATPIRQEFTATANQTVFTLTNGSYVTGSSMLSVFIWGQKQPPSAYTETSATSFTLAAGVPAGTKVLAEWFSNITLGAEGRAGQILKYTLTNISTDNQGRLWKSGGTDNSWDSQAYSAEAYTGGCFLSWKVNTTAVPIMFGLNTDPTTDASFSSLDYAWYMHNGNRKIYESNVNTYTSGTYAVGDVFAISYDGANVKYYHNGELCKTTAAAAGLKLYVDSSFYVKTVDYQLYDIFFAPAGAIGPQGPQGPQGIQGIQGIQGPQGPAGTLSATTNWTMAQNADGSLGFTYV